MKTLLRFLLRLLFGFRAYNEEVLKTPGPVLLLPNHVSWLDWLFLLVCTDKDWKGVVSERTAHMSWLHRKIMINRRTLPIDTDSPYAVKYMAEFLTKGGRLALFPEGRLSRTGNADETVRRHRVSPAQDGREGHHMLLARRAPSAHVAESQSDEMVPAHHRALQRCAYRAACRAPQHFANARGVHKLAARSDGATAVRS